MFLLDIIVTPFSFDFVVAFGYRKHSLAENEVNMRLFVCQFQESVSFDYLLRFEPFLPVGSLVWLIVPCRAKIAPPVSITYKLTDRGNNGIITIIIVALSFLTENAMHKRGAIWKNSENTSANLV